MRVGYLAQQHRATTECLGYSSRGIVRTTEAVRSNTRTEEFRGKREALHARGKKLIREGTLFRIIINSSRLGHFPVNV